MSGIFDLVPETHHDLLELAWAAALVTLDAEGRPQTTAVWYLADPDDGGLKVSLSDSRQKFAHLSANPEVGFLIVDPANQFRTLEVRGTARVALDEGKTLAGKVGAKYDADIASYDETTDTRYVVTIAPRKVVAH